MSDTEPQLLTPDSIRDAVPAKHPQKLDATYRLVDSKVLADEDEEDDFFESYSDVLIRESYGTVIRELVIPVERDGKTNLYGQVMLCDKVPSISEFEDLEQFYQYLILLDRFETIESHGNIATGVQAIKRWSGFAIESGSFRVLWLHLNVSIQSDDDQWCIHGRSIVELTYSAT